MKLYLHQFLSKSGVFSSKKILLDAIRSGEVRVDEEVITKANYHFNTEKHKVIWKDKEIHAVEPIYIVINKPVGYISSRITSQDTKLRKKSVFELLAADKSMTDEQKKSLICVGRLDEDTSGLLIICNDGQLGTKVTNPKHTIPKTYVVHLRYPLSENGKKRIEQGIRITLEENGKKTMYQTQLCSVELASPLVASIRIIEGKKRQIRRMFEAVGNKVVHLERVAIGELYLAELKMKPAHYLFVTREFIKQKLRI